MDLYFDVWAMFAGCCSCSCLFLVKGWLGLIGEVGDINKQLRFCFCLKNYRLVQITKFMLTWNYFKRYIQFLVALQIKFLHNTFHTFVHIKLIFDSKIIKPSLIPIRIIILILIPITIVSLFTDNLNKFRTYDGEDGNRVRSIDDLHVFDDLLLGEHWFLYFCFV